MLTSKNSVKTRKASIVYLAVCEYRVSDKEYA